MLNEVFNIISWIAGLLLPVVLMALPGDTDPPDPPAPPDPPDPPDDGTGTGSSGGGGGYPTVSNGTISLISVDQGAHTAKHRVTGSYTGNSLGEPVTRRFRSYKDGVRFYNPNFGGGTQFSAGFNSGSASPADVTCEADNELYSWRAGISTPLMGLAWAGLLYFKSAAVTATIGTPTEPTGANLEAFQAYIECTCYPNTLHSVATLQFQYRETGDPSWTDFGTSADAAGYSEVTFGRQLTGLTPDTAYDVRLTMTRDTENATSVDGDYITFSTLEDVPEVTTNSPSSVGLSQAVFSATVDYNSHDGNLYCRWSATDPGTPDDTTGTKVAYTDTVPMIGADGTYTGFGSEGGPVTGLIDVDEDLAETLYVWAIYEYGGGTYDDEQIFGDIVEFTTQAEPGAGGDGVDFMIPLQFDGQYGVDKTVYFTLRGLAAVDNDTFYTSTAPVQADVLIYVDGSYLGTATNAPALADETSPPTTNPLYKLTLDSAAGEMDGEIIDVIIHDDAGGPDFRDLHIQVRTEQKLSRIELNTDQMAGDQSAFYAKGLGAGHGMEAIGGATGFDISGILGKHRLANGDVTSGSLVTVQLTDGFDATGDFYNGDTIYFYEGTGAGQSREISDFTAGGEVTLSSDLISALDTDTKYVIIPGARSMEFAQGEVTSVPTAASPMKEKMQFLFQRFVFKMTQTATAQTWYDSSNEAFATRAVSDTGSTQEQAKLADL